MIGDRHDQHGGMTLLVLEPNSDGPVKIRHLGYHGRQRVVVMASPVGLGALHRQTEAFGVSRENLDSRPGSTKPTALNRVTARAVVASSAAV